MEPGYMKTDSRNLPRVDIVMVGNFFATNLDFCAAEFRNVKTSISARQSYGDDAIGYVQLRRESNICTIKCKVCPEHKIRAKSYEATIIIEEQNGKIISVQCHDCAPSMGGCKHAVAFLMWVHRRSEEPSSTDIQCYWKKSKLAQVGTNVWYITAKDLSAGKKPCSTQVIVQNNLLTQFHQEAMKPDVNTCETLRYNNCRVRNYEKLSLHYLITEYCDIEDCNLFLNIIAEYFTQENIKGVEEKTQYKDKLWHELCYGRIIASKAYEVSKCQTDNRFLIPVIMGAKIPDTKAMRRGRELETKVKIVIENILGKTVKECGWFISPQYPFIAGSPDGICENQFCIEIKCPASEKMYKNYLKDNKEIGFPLHPLLMILIVHTTTGTTEANYGEKHTRAEIFMKNACTRLKNQ